jgi:hypothetical protein
MAMQLGRTTTMRKSILTLLSGRTLITAAALASMAVVTTPLPAKAGISNGAAVALGLGSLALGTAIGSAAYANPYGYYPYGYYPPAPAYYGPPAPAYPYRTCWYPQYGGYYAC